MINLRTLPPDLQQRYGVGRRPILGIVVGALLGVVVLAGLGWIAWQKANPPARWALLTWSAVAPDHTRVTWEVRRSASDPVTCVLRVQDAQHHDVGYARVTLPAGTTYVQPTYLVATRAPGRAVELLGCAADDDPRVPGPDFPPGTENPPQPWTPGA